MDAQSYSPFTRWINQNYNKLFLGFSANSSLIDLSKRRGNEGANWINPFQRSTKYFWFILSRNYFDLLPYLVILEYGNLIFCLSHGTSFDMRATGNNCRCWIGLNKVPMHCLLQTYWAERTLATVGPIGLFCFTNMIAHNRMKLDQSLRQNNSEYLVILLSRVELSMFGATDRSVKSNTMRGSVKGWLKSPIMMCRLSSKR